MNNKEYKKKFKTIYKNIVKYQRANADDYNFDNKKIYSCRYFEFKHNKLIVKNVSQSNNIMSLRLDFEIGLYDFDFLEIKGVLYKVNYSPYEIDEVKTQIIISRTTGKKEEFESITKKDTKNISKIIEEYMGKVVSDKYIES